MRNLTLTITFIVSFNFTLQALATSECKVMFGEKLSSSLKPKVVFTNLIRNSLKLKNIPLLKPEKSLVDMQAFYESFYIYFVEKDNRSELRIGIREVNTQGKEIIVISHVVPELFGPYEASSNNHYQLKNFKIEDGFLAFKAPNSENWIRFAKKLGGDTIYIRTETKNSNEYFKAKRYKLLDHSPVGVVSNPETSEFRMVAN